MNTTRLFARAALVVFLGLKVLPKVHAQTYTFYPTDATINSDVTTDIAVVGYAGGSYNPNGTRNFTGPSSPTVQVVAGANVTGQEMDIFNSSVVNLSGGNVAATVSHDSSTLNVAGGSSAFVLNFDQSVINMSGGSVDDLEGQGKQTNVSGGTVGYLSSNGGTDDFGNDLGSSIVNVTGGSVTGSVEAFNSGILNIYGGLFSGGLRASEGGTINFYGSNLVASLIDPNYKNGYSLYSLSGVLDDGAVLTDVNLRVRNDGVTYGHSSFHLFNAVPEPGVSALLLSGGVSGIGLRMFRRKSGK